MHSMWRIAKSAAHAAGVLFVNTVFLPVIMMAWFAKAITDEDSLDAKDSG